MQKKKSNELDENSRKINEILKNMKSSIHENKAEGFKERPRDELHMEKAGEKDRLTK